MAAYFFSSPVDVDVRLEGEDVRKQVESKAEKDRPISSPVYYDGEAISGQVRFTYVCTVSPSFSRAPGEIGYGPRSRRKAHDT